MIDLARAVCLTLPWPPSVNTYWRRRGHQMFISKAGQCFRREVFAIVHEHADNAGYAVPLRVALTLCPPDHRRRDIDNILKSLFDALAHAGVYHDDSQIRRLHVEFSEDQELNGVVHCLVEPIT